MKHLAHGKQRNKHPEGKYPKKNSGAGKLFYSRFAVFLFFASTLTMLIIIFYAGRMMNDTIDFLVSNVNQRLITESSAVAELVTAEELSELRAPEDMQKPLFKEIRARLADYTDRAGILFGYYMRDNGEGSLQYIVDNDFINPVDLTTPPVPIEEASRLALDGISAAIRPGDYTEGELGYLTAYSPVVDSDGNVIAVAGVNIYDESTIATRRNFAILIALLFATMAIVLTSGGWGFILYRRRINEISEAGDQMPEAEARQNEVNESEKTDS